MKTDILIVGSGCAGLYCALHLPKDKQILIITKDKIEHSDSFLAQGGICMLKDERIMINTTRIPCMRGIMKITRSL